MEARRAAPTVGVEALAALAAESPDGLLIVSAQGEVLFRNRRFGEVWGISEPELASASDDAALASALERVVEPAAFITEVRRVYQRPEPAHDELRLRDGRALDRYGAPLHDADGAYIGYAWYFRDVTALREAEEEQRRLVTTLQVSLLPPGPPEIPGMDVATRYRPAGSVVGGDFFDVFRLGINSWGVSMGDVCGKGARAAAVTALSRYTLRAAAGHHRLPSEVLDELNAALLLDDSSLDDRFCTAVFARVELDMCGAWVTLAAAGHPLPVVVRQAGWIDVRGQPGNPVGLFAGPVLHDDRVGLGPGDALVLVTDGITESRRHNGDMFGEEALPELLLEMAGLPADDVASAVLDGALDFADGEPRDDIAVVVVRVPEDAGVADPLERVAAATGAPREALPLPGYPVGEPPSDVWSERSPSPREARLRVGPRAESVAAARRFVAGVLHSWRMSELAEGDVILLTSEVVTNALTHGADAPTVIVRYDGSHVRVEVGDGSPALPSQREAGPDDVGGRGLLLLDELSAGWGVLPTERGKRVWFDVPAPPA